MVECVIDIETLGTSFDSVVLSVGAVKFNSCGNSDPHTLFYVKLDMDHQVRLGRIISDSTIGWWSKQAPEVIEDTFSDHGRISLDEFVKQFNKYVVGCDVFWAQGAVFDFVILEHLYRSLGQPWPINYWECRDSRTLFKLFPSDPRGKNTEVVHHALSDAYNQAIAIQNSYSRLNLCQE